MVLGGEEVVGGVGALFRPDRVRGGGEGAAVGHPPRPAVLVRVRPKKLVRVRLRACTLEGDDKQGGYQSRRGGRAHRVPAVEDHRLPAPYGKQTAELRHCKLMITSADRAGAAHPASLSFAG